MFGCFLAAVPHVQLRSLCCFCQHVCDSVQSPLFAPCSLSAQSFSEKRRKNFIFSRKFPFYKNKDADEQDGSDSERKQPKTHVHSHTQAHAHNKRILGVKGLGVCRQLQEAHALLLLLAFLPAPPTTLLSLSLPLSLCLPFFHSLSFSAPLIGCVVQDISGIGEDGYGAKTLSKCVKEWTQYPSPNLTCNISVEICSFLLRQQQTCLHVRILMDVGLRVLMFQGFLHYHPQVYVVAKMLHELNTCENSLSNVVRLVCMSRLLCCFLMFSLAQLEKKSFFLAKMY